MEWDWFLYGGVVSSLSVPSEGLVCPIGKEYKFDHKYFNRIILITDFVFCFGCGEESLMRVVLAENRYGKIFYHHGHCIRGCRGRVERVERVPIPLPVSLPSKIQVKVDKGSSPIGWWYVVLPGIGKVGWCQNEEDWDYRCKLFQALFDSLFHPEEKIFTGPVEVPRRLHDEMSWEERGFLFREDYIALLECLNMLLHPGVLLQLLNDKLSLPYAPLEKKRAEFVAKYPSLGKEYAQYFGTTAREKYGC